MKSCLDLVERVVRRGDREALGALVAATHADVYRLLVSALGHEADAEDATQEVFRQVLQSIGTLREPEAFPGWIYRIALDKARQVRRGREAARRAEAAAAERALQSGETKMARLEADELRAAVKRAVDGLDDDLRETIRLRYEHELTYPEIARALSCPEGTVASRLSIAHRRLQQALAGAGAAVALAVLERELAAAPAAAAPERLARRVADMARSTPLDPGGTPAAPRGGTRAAGLAVAVGLALVVALVVVPRFMEKRPGVRAGAVTSATGPSGNGGADTAGGGPAAGATEGGPDRGSTAPREPAPPVSTCVLRGRITDALSGEPLAGVEVHLTPEAAPTALVTKSGADGSYRVDLAPGTLEVNAISETHVPWSIGWWAQYQQSPEFDPKAPRPWILRMAAGEERVLDFALTPATELLGLVTDESGAPIDGVRVHLEKQEFDGPDETVRLGYGSVPRERREAATDAAGRFRLGGLYPAGRVELRLTGTGWVPRMTWIDLTPGSTQATLVLKRARRIGGVVVDSAGAPVAGACVVTEDENHWYAVKRTGADGTFRLDDPPDTARWIVAWSSGTGWSGLRLPDGDAPDLRIVLPASTASVHGTIRDESGAPVPGARIVAASSRRREGALQGVVSFDVKGGGTSNLRPGQAGVILPEEAAAPSAIAGEDGAFALEGLWFGEGTTVRLVVQKAGFRLRLVDVAGSGRFDVTLRRGDLDDEDREGVSDE